MPIPVTCPGCTKQFRAPESAAGKQGKCPKCGTLIIVPSDADKMGNQPFDGIEAATPEAESAIPFGANISGPSRVSAAIASPFRRQTAAQPSPRKSSSKVSCAFCGATQRVELTHDGQFLRCDRCDGALMVPSQKAYDYEKARGRRNLMVAGGFVVVAGIAFLLLYQHSAAYLKTPEGVAYRHVHSTIRLDVALVSAEVDAKVLSTRPRCVESRDERLFLFLYELYYADRPDLGRAKRYVLVDNHEGKPKTLEVSAGFPPSGWKG